MTVSIIFSLDYFIIIKAADLKNFFTYIKKSLQTSNSYIIEASSCDTSNYNYTPFDKKNSLCLTKLWLIHENCKTK